MDAETEVGLTCYPDGSLTHATHVEKGVSKTVANDGLYWAKGRGGNVLILDEDSGNDYGERRYALPITGGMELRDAATGISWGRPVGPSDLAMKRVQRLWPGHSPRPAPMSSPEARTSLAW